MKFCYLDESGTGDEPYAVMVGVIVDAKRMHVTKQEWEGLLSTLSEIVGRTVEEIHTRDFYAGNGFWRTIKGTKRAQIITEVLKWLQQRKHSIVYSVVDKGKFYSDFGNEPYASDVVSLWNFMALHVCLSIQKKFQNESNNKGNTVVIFDNEDREAANFLRLIKSPPVWTETYYDRQKTQDVLDQIVDVLL